MKITVPKKSKKTPNGFVPFPIPLEHPAAKELEKDEWRKTDGFPDLDTRFSTNQMSQKAKNLVYQI